MTRFGAAPPSAISTTWRSSYRQLLSSRDVLFCVVLCRRASQVCRQGRQRCTALRCWVAPPPRGGWAEWNGLRTGCSSVGQAWLRAPGRRPHGETDRPPGGQRAQRGGGAARGPRRTGWARPGTGNCTGPVGWWWSARCWLTTWLPGLGDQLDRARVGGQRGRKAVSGRRRPRTGSEADRRHDRRGVGGPPAASTSARGSEGRRFRTPRGSGPRLGDVQQDLLDGEYPRAGAYIVQLVQYGTKSSGLAGGPPSPCARNRVFRVKPTTKRCARQAGCAGRTRWGPLGALSGVHPWPGGANGTGRRGSAGSRSRLE